MKTELHALPAASAGTTRHVRSLHFGEPGRGPKAYIHAALHADEVPAMLVAQHLRQRLLELEGQGRLSGEVVLLPLANPIGLAQDLQGAHFGRFDAATGQNFNRGYRSLSAALAPRLEAQLGADAAANVALIRREALALLGQWQPQTETEALKRLLQGLALDADVVLDLHCDHQAVMHLYAGTPLEAPARELGAWLGAEALLLCRDSGDEPFDETVSRLWWELAERFAGRFPVPLACFAATVELRGEAQTDHGLAARDAQALLAFLQTRGLISGPPLMPRPAERCQPTPLEGVEPLSAPHSGLLVFAKQPGDEVSAGEVVAELIDPLDDRVSLLRASVSGRLFARVSRRWATRGMRVAKIAGAEAYRSGKLLSL